MAENEQNLTIKETRLIEALLHANNLTEAAGVAGIPYTTALRMKDLAHVQRALREAQEQYFTFVLRGLYSASEQAIATLIRNMSADSPPAQQVAAARILLEKAIEIHKMSELEARLQELEARLETPA